MTRLNLTLWLLGLLLQGMLLALMWARRWMGRLPGFTILLSFYCLRSVLLVITSHGGQRVASPLLLTALALLDIALQVVVAWQIFASAPGGGQDAAKAPGPRSGMPRLAAGFSMLVLLASAASALLPLCFHGTRRYQMDRGVLITSFLFLLILVTFSWRKRPRVVRTLALGLGVFAIASLTGQVGRTLAAVARDAHAFTRWSYVEPIAYLSIVMFWLVALFHGTTTTQVSKANAASHSRSVVRSHLFERAVLWQYSFPCPPLRYSRK